VGDVALIIFLHELQLCRRAFQVQINNHEIDPAFVLFIKIDGAASLPLGVESTLAIKDDVVRLSFNRAFVHVLTRDQRPVPAVA
jgi:hypothetical protein